MHRFILLFGFLLASVLSHAQHRQLDSLLVVLKKQVREDTVRLNLLNELAYAYSGINPDQGIVTADQAIALAQKLGDPVKLAAAYTNKGVNYATKGEDSLALGLYRRAQAMHEKVGNRLGVARTLHNQGLLLHGASKYPEALQYHLKAAAIFSQLRNQRLQMNALNSAGVNYMYLANYPEALGIFQKVGQLGTQLGDRLMTAHAFNNSGIIYKNLTQYDKALASYTKALHFYEQVDNRSGMASTLGNMATVYDFTGKPTKALVFYQRALTINRAIGNKRGEASDLTNIGIVYTDLANYPRALPYLEQGFRLYKQLGEKRNMSLLLENIATVYREASTEFLQQHGVAPNRRYATVLNYQKQGLRLAQEANALDYQTVYWESLSETYAANRDFANALTAYKQYIILRDSTLNDKKKVAVARKEMQFAQEKREAVLKAEHAAELNQQRTERNVAIGGGSLLLLASTFGFLLYKRKREADEQRKEAELKAAIADTEMKALRAQMNPHFIFNSLNSISDYLLKHDVRTADYYLTKFAKLMRLILENSEKKQVMLADDLQALELYMQLEALRMRNQFTYEIQVDETLDPDETLIPPLLLQPFVENSIWHGLAWKEGAGKITVHIRKEGDMINCIVEDNGIGRLQSKSTKTATETPERKSLGMKLTSARIAIINQQKQTKAAVTLSDLAEGTRVEVKLPLELSF